MDPMKVNPNNIWSYKQNKPSLIAMDMAEIYNVPFEGTLKILMARGVFKWLAVRRDLIRLKNDWKGHIRFCQDDIKVWKDKLNNDNLLKEERIYQYNYGYTRGKLEAYTKCRNEVRTLCHGERWTVPDFEKHIKIEADGSILFGRGE